jgi:hypothetical protein
LSFLSHAVSAPVGICVFATADGADCGLRVEIPTDLHPPSLDLDLTGLSTAYIADLQFLNGAVEASEFPEAIATSLSAAANASLDLSKVSSDVVITETYFSMFCDARSCCFEVFDPDTVVVSHFERDSWVKNSLLCEIFVTEWKMIVEISVNFRSFHS